MKRAERGAIPQRPCSSCGRRDRWERVEGGGWGCSTCYGRPAPEDAALMREIMGRLAHFTEV